MNYYKSWKCKQDENPEFTIFNTLGTLFFSEEGNTIRTLFFADTTTFRTVDMLIMAVTWYVFTISTYGVSIPSGIFLPGIIMGQALGRFYTKFVARLFNQQVI